MTQTRISGGPKNYREPATPTGFTIVELLIVIVVIGILATVVIVAFNGVRRSAIEASLKAELNNSSKGFATDQVHTPTNNNPSGSQYLYRETSLTTVAYAHGNTMTYCLESRSKTDAAVVFYQFYGVKPTSFTAGSCPTPDYRTSYRCVAGRIISTYTLKNTTDRAVSFKIIHSSSGDEQNYSGIQPGETKSGTSTLRTTSVQRGVIDFTLYDTSNNQYIDTYYQASPALTC
jgi:prepilin-type N-terminal cleavage/methylation domain-containing protein